MYLAIQFRYLLVSTTHSSTVMILFPTMSKLLPIAMYNFGPFRPNTKISSAAVGTALSKSILNKSGHRAPPCLLLIAVKYS